MFKFDNLFVDLFGEVDKMFADAEKVTDKVALPMNIIREEDGSSTVEIAVVGKTRDDISVKGVTENGKSYLVIESAEQEKTEDEKKAEEKRSYSLHKIKGAGKLSVKLLIPSVLDIKGSEVKVENGLLTVKIPAAEEAKPIEFEIK